jgi:hypothetical protein
VRNKRVILDITSLTRPCKCSEIESDLLIRDFCMPTVVAVVCSRDEVGVRCSCDMRVDPVLKHPQSRPRRPLHLLFLTEQNATEGSLRVETGNKYAIS